MFSFTDIIGQDTAGQRLIAEAQAGRIAHALLLCGPQGAGKLPLALAYARYLCCLNPQANDACGQCPSCRKWDKLSHPDAHFVFPIIKNTKIKKETCDDYLPAWRQLLTEHNPGYISQDQWLQAMNSTGGQPIIYARESDELTRKLSFKPGGNGRRTVLIWLPEKLHETCANKLLKLMEEPPEGSIFLLVSEEPERILPTVVSRAQRFNIGPADNIALAQAMQHHFGLNEADSLATAHSARGNVLKALETIRSDEGNKQYFEWFTALMRLAYQRKIRQLKTWSEDIASIGRERQKAFLEYAQQMIRESFIYNLRQPMLNYLSDSSERNFVHNFAPFVNERNVWALMDVLAEAQNHIEQNANPRMVFFDLTLQIIMLLKN